MKRVGASANDGRDQGRPSNSKRLKTMAPTSDATSAPSTAAYRVGTILRLKVQNFVTYTEAEIFPGPRLNVILGPNGTGKSSLVCAIVLGLCGHPSALGRAKNLHEFIKLGCDRSTIEIELQGAPGRGSVLIHRVLHKESKQDVWRLDNRPASYKEVLEVTRRLNIHVENLCQLLPQDLVSSFASMDHVELLQETEVAVGGESLKSEHVRLSNLKRDESVLRNQHATKQKYLGDLTERFRATEAEVARYREYERCAKELLMADSKKNWLHYEDMRQRSIELQSQYRGLENKKRKLDAEISKGGRAVEQQVKETKICAERVMDIVGKSRSLSAELSALTEGAMKEVTNTAKIEAEISDLRSRAEQGKQMAEKYRERLRGLQAKQKSLEAAETQKEAQKRALNEQFEALVLEKRNLQLEMSDQRANLEALEQRIDEARLVLRSVEDVQLRMRSMLAPKFSNVLYYRDWVKVSLDKGVLKNNIYGPLLFEIQVADETHASFFEKVISHNYKMAFIALSEEDRDAFLAHGRMSGVVPPLIMYNKDSEKRFPHPVPVSEMSDYGVEGYIDEIICTNDVVKAELCRQCRLHCIPYGSSKLEKNVDSMKRFFRRGVTCYLSPRYIYQVSVSRYRSAESSLIDQLRPARFFVKVDLEESSVANETVLSLEQQKIQVHDAIGRIRRRVEEINDHLPRIREDIRALSGGGVAVVRAQVLDVERALKDCVIDVDAESLSLDGRLKESLNARLQSAEKIHRITESIVNAYALHTKALLERAGKASKLDAFKKAYHQKKLELGQLTDEMSELHGQLSQSMSEAAKFLEMANMCPPSEEVRRFWESLPDDLENLENVIASLRVKSGAAAPDPDVVDRYRQCKREIEEVNRSMGQSETSLRQVQEQLVSLKSSWLAKVEAIVAEIDSKFSAFFSEINCRGRVKLAVDADDDFSKYGIEIWVSYRASEDMKRLSVQVQSGGERSVATMLYLIALQTLSDCPFRLVDEINQGMDQYNERLVFDQIVLQASQPNTPQYFLITPKLLPDLKFTPSVTVHCIYNGPHMVPSSDWVACSENS
ncbi:structural maintenance of chromosomes protein 5-like [Schistocerca gregaria]|uniref:structural maintenance of chromosomes protein 5-like n=1 Tax=Schistocerca gregaria TaxID=7010 RepID=UPI00211E6D1B|nr:structural maintenance of chromosomes protein 5-like [Schistocerca gregaria]